MSARATLEAAERQWAAAGLQPAPICTECGTFLTERELSGWRLCSLCRAADMRADSEGMFDREDC